MNMSFSKPTKSLEILVGQIRIIGPIKFSVCDVEHLELWRFRALLGSDLRAPGEELSTSEMGGCQN